MCVFEDDQTLLCCITGPERMSGFVRIDTKYFMPEMSCRKECVSLRRHSMSEKLLTRLTKIDMQWRALEVLVIFLVLFPSRNVPPGESVVESPKKT